MLQWKQPTQARTCHKNLWKWSLRIQQLCDHCLLVTLCDTIVELVRAGR